MELTEIGPITVADVSGQKAVRVSSVPSDATVDEVVRHLLGEMKLPANDAEGRPVTYHARLERESRHLQGKERIGDTLQAQDHLILQPNVDAGSGLSARP